MKDKTITVRVPDFCPEDCPGFEIHAERCEYHTLDGVYERMLNYACEHEGRCRMLYSEVVRGHLLKHGCCNDCRNPKCEWKPKLGDDVRINCPHWMGEAIGVNNNAGMEN